MRNALEWALTGLQPGHESSLEGLHPHLKASLEEAQSVMSWIARNDEVNHITDIGVESAAQLKSVYFAALDKTGEKAQELGYRPRVAWLSEPCDLYEVPGGLVLTVGSTITARMALALVSFTDVDVSGYGDWSTAYANAIHVFDTHAEAEAMLTEIAKAVRTIRTASRKIDGARGEAKSRVTNAPAF